MKDQSPIGVQYHVFAMVSWPTHHVGCNSFCAFCAFYVDYESTLFGSIPAKIMIFFMKTDAFVVFGSFGNEPMQSCSVHHVSSLSLLSALASVYSPPSDRFDHRSFISYKYMQLCP